MTAKQAVEKGIKFLDNDVDTPSNWRSKVDTSVLDINSVTKCILGQIFGEYDRGMARTGLTDLQTDDYGFRSETYSSESLNRAWTDALLGTSGALLEVGQVLVGRSYSSSALKLRVFSFIDGKNFWGCESGKMENGKFVPASYDDRYALCTQEDILRTWKALARFKKGDVLKSKDGGFLFVYRDDEKVLRLNTGVGSNGTPGYASLEYYENTYGKLELVTMGYRNETILEILDQS